MISILAARPLSAALSLAVLLVTACDYVEPDVGSPLRARCVDQDSDPENDVSYQRDIVQGIFNVRVDSDGQPTGAFGCWDCHRPDAETPFGFTVGGLDLSEYETLRAGGRVSSTNIVVPGRPCDSIIVQKVSPGPPFGARMPLDGPPFLDDQARLVLQDWIAEGAVDN